MIHRLVLPGAILFLFAVVVSPQKVKDARSDSTANFSGVWLPEGERTKKPEAGPQGWTNVAIEQKDAEVKFRLIYPPDATPPTREFVYYTDERGETNNGTVYFFLLLTKKWRMRRSNQKQGGMAKHL
ncbi:MAG TPA: hypothetical protein VE863_05385 [Pyrinomonadaceae bacterium]|jgi:hypothetical protein|nr:hypothetical protein [Pyrinomonadaceae bacterium]